MHTHHIEVTRLLDNIEQSLRQHSCWSTDAPLPVAFKSTLPFCIDTMSAEAWLQWVFLPKMRALIEAGSLLPTQFMVTPYLEEAMSEKITPYFTVIAVVGELEKWLASPE